MNRNQKLRHGFSCNDVSGGLLIRPSLKRRTAGLEFDKRPKKSLALAAPQAIRSRHLVRLFRLEVEGDGSISLPSLAILGFLHFHQ
jgi:hypothetical protein